MRLRWLSVALAGAALGCVGCGSLSQTTMAKVPLTAFVVRGDDLTGINVSKWQHGVFRSARSWVATSGLSASANAAWVRQLTREGFREGVTEGTNGSSAPGGGSAVTVFGSAASAAHDQWSSLHGSSIGGAPASAWTRFTASGIPGASGITISNGEGGTGNVYFVQGRCEIFVGDEVVAGTDPVPPLLHAVHAIWARTHGKPSECTT